MTAFAYEIAYRGKRTGQDVRGRTRRTSSSSPSTTSRTWPSSSRRELHPEGVLREPTYHAATEQRTNKAQILASVAMLAALRAAQMLAAERDVADVWSVTSWGELNRDGAAIETGEKLRR